jgi:hypothetical protein
MTSLHIPLTTYVPLGETNVAKHPGQVEHDIQNHENVVDIVVVAGRYVHPASARKCAQYARC